MHLVEPEETREDVWTTWNKQAAPPPDKGQPGYGRLWLQWAVSRFALFRAAPQPMAYATMADWVRPFDQWGRATSPATQNLVRCLLDFYNNTVRWKCLRARSIDELARRLDPGNREGLAALIIHAKGF